MKLQTLALGAALGAMVFSAGCTSLSGESKMVLGGSTSGAANAKSNYSDDLANALARAEMAQAEAEAARADTVAAKMALAVATRGAATNSGGDLFPPNPVPGHCYARVLIPATFVEQTEQILVKAESTRLEVTQPEYEWISEQKLVREASARIEVIPAEFKTITEQVLVKPETTRLVSVAAQFETITEQVIDKPARTEWKRGSRYINSALETRTDLSSGEVMCLVDVPASYKTISRTIQTVAPSVKEVVEAAEYKTVARTVVAKPASTQEVLVPAQYTTVQKLELVKPGETKEIVVPAEYETISKKVQTGTESQEWREALCEVNMTRQVVSELQQILHTEGYFDSAVDGIYQRLTQIAVNRYAKNNGLPFGSNYIPLEVANALGLNY